MPLPSPLRPIVLPSARHLSSIPSRLLYSPIIHQHHHRRTTTTLRPSAKSQNYAFLAGFLAGCAIATFGAASWLRPQRSTIATNTVLHPGIYPLYAQIIEKLIMPDLRKAFHEHLGCHNVRYEATAAFKFSTAPNDDVANVPDILMGLFFDTDAASVDMRNVIGVGLSAIDIEELELVRRLRHMLKEWERQGLLRREGMAVCLVSGKDADGIWVYGKEGVEVEGADFRVWGEEGGWMSRIFSLKKDW